MTTTDPRALRDAFGAFLTGVTVITTVDESGNPLGFTANSFTSVSLDPPLLLVCLARSSRNYAALTKAGGFAVNILSETQKDVSNTFARPVEDRFSAVEWRKGPHGSPVFANVAAWFDCTMESIVDGGDHAILIGRVQAFENGGANGLGYARGSYFTPALGQKAVLAAGGDTQVQAGAVAVRDGKVLLIQQADGRYALPAFAMAAGESSEILASELTKATGLKASVGFVYSVYEDRANARNHIVYRCQLGGGKPRNGVYFALADIPFDSLADSSTKDILKRYAAECVLGNFGMYVGNEQSGRVHAVGGKQTQ